MKNICTDIRKYTYIQYIIHLIYSIWDIIQNSIIIQKSKSQYILQCGFRYIYFASIIFLIYFLLGKSQKDDMEYH